MFLFLHTRRLTCTWLTSEGEDSRSILFAAVELQSCTAQRSPPLCYTLACALPNTPATSILPHPPVFSPSPSYKNTIAPTPLVCLRHAAKLESSRRLRGLRLLSSLVEPSCMEGQWSRTYDIFVGGREEEEGRRLMDGACDSLGHRGGGHGGSDGLYGPGGCSLGNKV